MSIDKNMTEELLRQVVLIIGNQKGQTDFPYSNGQ